MLFHQKNKISKLPDQQLGEMSYLNYKKKIEFNLASIKRLIDIKKKERLFGLPQRGI